MHTVNGKYADSGESPMNNGADHGSAKSWSTQLCPTLSEAPVLKSLHIFLGRQPVTPNGGTNTCLRDVIPLRISSL